MAARASTIALGPATDQPVARATERSSVIEMMRAARSWFPHKPSVELAQIVGCDVRTAERYFAGERTPDAVALLAILRSEHGAKMVEAAVADLPAKEQRKFWSEMAKAVLRASLADD